MNEEKTHRLWQPVQFTDNWLNCDTSVLDDISSSWFSRRATLKEDSGEYAEFLNKLKREHAIETGVIERLYDLKKGITETFIKEGFVRSYLSHGDTDIPEQELMAHLKRFRKFLPKKLRIGTLKEKRNINCSLQTIEWKCLNIAVRYSMN